MNVYSLTIIAQDWNFLKKYMYYNTICIFDYFKIPKSSEIVSVDIGLYSLCTIQQIILFADDFVSLSIGKGIYVSKSIYTSYLFA